MDIKIGLALWVFNTSILGGLCKEYLLNNITLIVIFNKKIKYNINPAMF